MAHSTCFNHRYNEFRSAHLTNEAEAFIEKIRDLVNNVRSILSSPCSAEIVDKTFNKALAFLGQPLPALGDNDAEAEEASELEETRMQRKALSDLEDKVNCLETKLQSLTNASNDGKEMSHRLDQRLTCVVKEMKEERKTHGTALLLAEENLTKMRKYLHKSLKAQTQSQDVGKQVEAEGTTSASSSEDPESVVVVERFSVGTPLDEERPIIESIALMPSGLVVVGDHSNTVVKVFNQQGQFVNQWLAPGNPSVCALKDVKLAVVYCNCKQLDIFSITQTSVGEEASYTTGKGYRSITLLSPSSLAAGFYSPYNGLDVLTVTGQILRTIRTDLCPVFMCLSAQGTLVCCRGGDIFEVDAHTSQTLSMMHVPQISNPRGIAVCTNGNYIICDAKEASLSMLTPNMNMTWRPWSAQPGDLSGGECMRVVAVQGDTCVAVSWFGKVFVMRLSF